MKRDAGAWGRGYKSGKSGSDLTKGIPSSVGAIISFPSLVIIARYTQGGKYEGVDPHKKADGLLTRK